MAGVDVEEHRSTFCSDMRIVSTSMRVRDIERHDEE
jgi:hypothetical protein